MSTLSSLALRGSRNVARSTARSRQHTRQYVGQGLPARQDHDGDHACSSSPSPCFSTGALRRAGTRQRCCAKRYVGWKLFGAVIAPGRCVGCTPAVRANARMDLGACHLLLGRCPLEVVSASESPLVIVGCWVRRKPLAAMRASCLLFCVGLVCARDAFRVERPFDEETLADAEAILRKDCGESCVEAQRKRVAP